MGDHCGWHVPDNLPYLSWHADADRRYKAGERQRQCPDCKKWIWPDLFGEKPSAVGSEGEQG